MRVCTKCGQKAGRKHNFCPNCGGEIEEIETVASEKGAKARLVVLSIAVVVSIVATIASLTNEKLDMTRKLIEAIGGFGLCLLIGDWFWGFMKWIRVVAPKSFSLANKVGTVMLFGPFSGFIQLAVYLLVLIVPIAVFGYTFIIIFQLGLLGAKNPTDLLANLGMLLAGLVLTVSMFFWDICALKGVSPFGVLKQKFAKK